MHDHGNMAEFASRLGGIVESQTHIYRTIRGCNIRADVYPASQGAALCPALVWIHGGALIEGNRRQIVPEQLAAYHAAGFTVVAIDHRLAPETKLPAIVEDVQAAFDWLREAGPTLFGIDPARIGVVGHSAGGYLALLSGLVVSPRPRALVAFYGYGDILGDWYAKPDAFYRQQPLVSSEQAHAVVGGPLISEAHGARFDFYLYCRQQGRWLQEVGGRDPELEPSFFAPFCPVRHVSADTPPTMLLHGDQDTDVPYEQSVMMAEALAHAGVEHRLLTIPGGGHGFDWRWSDPQVEPPFREVLTFLDRTLNPEAMARTEV